MGGSVAQPGIMPRRARRLRQSVSLDNPNSECQTGASSNLILRDCVMRIGMLLLGLLIAMGPSAAVTSHTSHSRSSGYSRSYSHSYSSHSVSRSRGSSYQSRTYRAHSSSTHVGYKTRSYKPRSTSAYGSAHSDSHGRIKRSSAAKDSFKRHHPCPSTGRHTGACPGYVIDHVRALECGGADSPENMQWQTVSAAKAKDRTERHCR
jgi:hypothetical protein